MAPPTLDDVRRALRARPPSRLPGPLPRQAAVALILHAAGAGIETLLIRRADRPGDPWSGQVAFPGGRAEPGESGVETAVRETREEVGLDLAAEAEVLGGLDEIQAIGRSRPLGLSIQPWVFGMRGAPHPLRCSGEVASAHWLRLRDLLDPAREAPFPYELEGRTLQLPSVRLEGLVIWGLTYRMLRTFAELLGGSSAPGGHSPARE